MRQLVEGQGGSVAATSNGRGCGSTFHMFAPALFWLEVSLPRRMSSGKDTLATTREAPARGQRGSAEELGPTLPASSFDIATPLGQYVLLFVHCKCP